MPVIRVCDRCQSSHEDLWFCPVCLCMLRDPEAEKKAEEARLEARRVLEAQAREWDCSPAIADLILSLRLEVEELRREVYSAQDKIRELREELDRK